MKMIIVKTKAKTSKRVIEAIINHNFIMGEGFSLNGNSNDLCTLYTRDAVKMIFDNFHVIPKDNNIFNLKKEDK